MATTDALALGGGDPAVRTQVGRRWPEILPEDRAAVLRVLDRGVTSGAKAPENAALEREYAEYVGVQHCLSLNSGTAALHCCLAGAGIEPGDEVIVPAFTFMATAMAVAQQGAVPVFCDVTADTFDLDPARIEERVTDRTRAVMPVHLHGMPADMAAIGALAESRDVALIEDTAQAHGALYQGRMVGALGICAGTSLQETKNLPGGDGGLLVTDDEDVYLAASRLRMFGEDVYEPEFGRYYWSHGLGWNYRNHELSAAFARSQLRRLDGYLETARRNAGHLTRRLATVAGVRAPVEPEGSTSAWYAYRVSLDGRALGYSGPMRDMRDRVLRALNAEGVPATIWQDFALPAHPVFRRPAIGTWSPGRDQEPLRAFDPAEFPVSAWIADSSLLLCSPYAPLAVLDTAVLDEYANAVEKVMRNLEALLDMPLAAIDRRPPHPHERV